MSEITSIDELATVIDDTPAPERVLVGLVGAPGAGKSTAAEQLVGRLGSGAALLPMDGFHLPQSRLVELGRRDRMGAPDTFDVDGFVTLLGRLRGESDVLAPGFDREIEEAVPDALLIPADAPTVVIEGNYLLLDRLGWERVAPLLDVTVFVSVSRDIRLSRLIARHERYGKSEADARAWALGPDESNALVIEATASRADHVLRL